LILRTITVGPFAMNCYVVGSEKTKRGVVIDPGDEGEKILRVLRETGLTIEYILNTHAHLDHVLAVQAVKDGTGAAFCLHEADLPLLNMLPMQAAMFGLSVKGVPKVDRFLKHGDTLTLDDLSFRVLHTPGHTPGGVSFFTGKAVFVGDALFAGSIGRTDLWGGSYETLLESIRSKLFTLPDDVVVYPGHGPETTIGCQRRSNPFLQ